MNKILNLLLVLSLCCATHMATACNSIWVSPANPSPGQTVYFSLSGCNSACFSSCLGNHARWYITYPGSFVINGTTYNGSAQVNGTGFNATFSSNGAASITFTTQGNCTGGCNSYLTQSVTIGPIAPPTISRPSTSLVDDDLTKVWETAGADKSDLPTEEECINIHTRNNIASRFRDGFRVNVANLQTLINGTDDTKLSVVYFQAAKYYFDKHEQITIGKKNVVLGGEGATQTEFIIDDISTHSGEPAKDFITVSGANTRHVGITCLSIETNGAFNSSFYHDKGYNSKFKNKAVIRLKDVEDCWLSGVQITRGYGSTVSIDKGKHNEIKNCFFNDHWTLGGTRTGVNKGGTQGYSVNISNSDNNLIENNRMRLSRHNVIVQGDGTNNSLSEFRLSSGNVIAYNFLHDGEAKNWWGTIDHPWNITFHGGGKNKNNLVEGNICRDKIGIDDEKESNGKHNTLYRNFSATQIDVEKGSGCFNIEQIIIGNVVYKRPWNDRYKIKGHNQLIRGNKKCNSNGNNCNSGTFNVGSSCSASTNKNDPLNPGQSLGQSCYLTAVPDFLNFLPISNPNNVIPARNFTSAPADGCFTCTNVTLPPRIIGGGGGGKDPKIPVDLEDNMKSADNTEDAATPLAPTENRSATAFPNPSAGIVTIQLSNAAATGQAVFQLFDLSGKKLAERRVVLNSQNSFEYDLSNLEAGTYLGTITSNGETYSVKIVKK